MSALDLINIREGDCVAEKAGFGRAQADLGRGMLEVVYAKTLEKCSNGADVVGGVGVKDDHVVEVRDHVLYTADDLVDDLDEPPSHAFAASWHAEPLEQRGLREEIPVSGTVSLCAVNSWKYDTKSNREMSLPLPRESNTLYTRGMES